MNGGISAHQEKQGDRLVQATLDRPPKLAAHAHHSQRQLTGNGAWRHIPKNARIRNVEAAIAKKKESLLLIELVCVAKTPEFKVTYLKLFDREVEYKRYFPKKTFYDTIKLTFDSTPKDSTEFVVELKKITRRSLKKLGKS